MVLLGILVAILVPAQMSWPYRSSLFLARAAHSMAYWAIPEVQVLAVLVALTKLGSAVNVTICAGFWFYCGMTVALIFAWGSFTLSPPAFPSVTLSNKQVHPNG
jgi:paraquat-inducible protein A